MRRGPSYRVNACRHRVHSTERVGSGGAMADNEQAEGAAAEGAEAVPKPKGKLKLMIAVAGVLVILGAGAATWFMFFRGHGEETHADAAPMKPPSFIEV